MKDNLDVLKFVMLRHWDSEEDVESFESGL
jgi:hypothetical protein